MEIKVVTATDPNQNLGSKQTHLYEGEDPFYYEVYFNNREEFLKAYDLQTHNLSGHVIGLPNDIWDDSKLKDEYKGSFLCLFYSKGAELKFVIIMESRIWITSKGQTIDTLVI